ncbi:hypothetical protein PRZ48_004586 [Zasmidium cellare]|uniref:Uncharacterized protein n=1 Tax=Zasmidium cellare TaxID=395010 RepID=A0ABR0EPZ2_ZASCE|nr:hypothetical protein PRZ48_004586 [Zasmidium cellare]
MHARFFLAWLAIAIIAVLARASNEYDDEVEDPDGIPLKVRSALAEEALGLLHEHGENIDVSLDGYEHKLVARDLEDEATIEGLDARDAGLDYEALRKLGRMKPHHVQHQARDDAEDDEDDEYDDTPYVDLDPEDEDAADREPDPVVEANEATQPQVSERAVGDDEEDFEEVFGDEEDEEEDEVESEEPGSYDSGLYERSFGSEDEDEDEDDQEDIDYSLEGYDPRVLRRGEDDDDEFDEETFDFHSFLSESPDSPASVSGAHISERDIAADADEDFEGSTDEWYLDERRNARYTEPEPTVLKGKPLQAKRTVEEDDDEDEGAFLPAEEVDDADEDDV